MAPPKTAGLSGGGLIQGGVVMRLIRPGEEFPAELSGIFDTVETFPKPRLILQGFEVTFGEGVVIRDMRPAVRFDDAKFLCDVNNGISELGYLGLRKQPPQPLTSAHLLHTDGHCRRTVGHAISVGAAGDLLVGTFQQSFQPGIHLRLRPEQLL